MNPKNFIINKFFPDNQVKTVWSESFQWFMTDLWRKRAIDQYPENRIAPLRRIYEEELENFEHWDTSWLKEKYPNKFK
tara:strand:- start:149 stop:382 length:234 start_codon:yes stop_codon:yes gene_type:complete